jgi:hypothetical protein
MLVWDFPNIMISKLIDVVLLFLHFIVPKWSSLFGQMLFIISGWCYDMNFGFKRLYNSIKAIGNRSKHFILVFYTFLKILPFHKGIFN